jgi:hypothetical protein
VGGHPNESGVAMHAAPSKMPVLDGVRVLIVDDDPAPERW